MCCLPQGNFELYLEGPAAKRRAIKEDGRLQAAIGMFWSTFNTVQEASKQAINTRDAHVPKQEQLEVIVKFAKALFHQNEFSVEDAKRSALVPFTNPQ